MADTKPWGWLKANLYSLFTWKPKSNRLAIELAELRPTDVTLDIGCGPGVAVREAAPLVARAVGVDTSEAMIDVARRRTDDLDNVDYHVGGAEALPFDDAMFSAVWTIYAFHHWSDQDAGLGEVARVLAPGGRFLIIERKTRGKHGLSQDGADDLGSRLTGRGYDDVAVTLHDKHFVVSGRRA